MTIIVTAAVFALVNAIILATFYFTGPEIRDRRSFVLRGLSPKGAVENQRRRDQAGSPLQRMLVTLGGVGFRSNEKSWAYKLTTAGMRNVSALPMFLGMRTLLSFGPAIIALAPKMMSGEPMGKTLYMGVALFFFGHFGCNYWLNAQSQGRIRKITESLPDALDLMVVCLEAGLGLNAAIQRVGEERSAHNDPLGKELTQVHAELRAGRAREESMHDLGVRNGSEDLKSLTALIIQSNRLGASVGQTLRAHADLLRTKRRQRAEEAARKLPIKILIPLATLLLPPLFIVVIGPAFLRFSDMVDFLTNQ